MTTRRPPLPVEPDSANERFKGHFGSYLWSAIIVATVAHFAVFAYTPAFTTADISYVADEITTVDLPPEIDIPPAPKSIPRPATPVIATMEVSEDLTIAPTTFAMNPVDELPPPPAATRTETREIGEAPTFTPFTLPPEILNRKEIIDAMRDAYPPLLKASGIGGEVRVYFFIDEEGHVESTRLDRSSGYETLDRAALDVAELYRFSPAMNRDKHVPVWVSFPITFQVLIH